MTTETESQTPNDAAAQAPAAAQEAQTTETPNPSTEEGQGEAATTQETTKTDGAPETYSFEMGEEVGELGQKLVPVLEATARELNLPQEAANKLLEFGDQVYSAIQAHQMEVYDQTTAQWSEQTKNDPELGGAKLAANLEVADKAMQAFAPEGSQLRSLLGAFDPETNPNGTGLGNHPEIVRLFYNIGKKISEDSFVRGNGGGQPTPRSHAERLYGGTKT